jgi:hypothetical protein
MRHYKIAIVLRLSLLCLVGIGIGLLGRSYWYSKLQSTLQTKLIYSYLIKSTGAKPVIIRLEAQTNAIWPEPVQRTKHQNNCSRIFRPFLGYTKSVSQAINQYRM